MRNFFAGISKKIVVEQMKRVIAFCSNEYNF